MSVSDDEWEQVLLRPLRRTSRKYTPFVRAPVQDKSFFLIRSQWDTLGAHVLRMVTW